MIKHHPTFELLKLFVSGDLPASLSAGVAIHAEMCPKCQDQIAQLTDQVAEHSFEETYLDRFIVDDADVANDAMSIDFEAMADEIMTSNDITSAEPEIEKNITFNNKSYKLPRAIRNMSFGKPANIGKLSRARIQLDEDEIRTSLLQMQPGGSVPEHTHKGFELTLLLEGTFHDGYGEYVKGDFIMLDGTHLHNPESTNGCLCYTVANDALHFTQGINKLLNPIASFIY